MRGRWFAHTQSQKMGHKIDLEEWMGLGQAVPEDGRYPLGLGLSFFCPLSQWQLELSFAGPCSAFSPNVWLRSLPQPFNGFLAHLYATRESAGHTCLFSPCPHQHSMPKSSLILRWTSANWSQWLQPTPISVYIHALLLLLFLPKDLLKGIQMVPIFIRMSHLSILNFICAMLYLFSLKEFWYLYVKYFFSIIYVNREHFSKTDIYLWAIHY